MDFEKEWNLETALQIVQHPTVDSRTWAEAVEWLLRYGPPEIREILLQASGHATRECFPELKPEGFTDQGEPCYKIDNLARALNISEEEAARLIAEKEQKHATRLLFANEETRKIQ